MAIELLVNFNEFWSRLRGDIARARDVGAQARPEFGEIDEKLY